MRLIDADEIEKLFLRQVALGATDLIAAFYDALQDAQIVDAAEVVRCKDCKHELTNNQRYICCRRNGFNSALNFHSDSF
ncbi:MAG: hypothetical protein ACI3XQ_06025 [Eubacteriales bacterium]